jgi:hypothetical protein
MCEPAVSPSATTTEMDEGAVKSRSFVSRAQTRPLVATRTAPKTAIIPKMTTIAMTLVLA